MALHHSSRARTWWCPACNREWAGDPEATAPVHSEGWHVSAKPLQECMTGPGKADSRCFTEPVTRTMVDYGDVLDVLHDWPDAQDAIRKAYR